MKLKDEIIQIEKQCKEIENIRDDITDIMNKMEI